MRGDDLHLDQANGYPIKLPYVTAKYTVYLCGFNIVTILLNDRIHSRIWTAAYMTSVILSIVMTFILARRELKKERTLVMEENHLVIDGIRLAPDEMKHSAFAKHHIEVATSKKAWAQRIIRFEFEAADKDANRILLRAWFRRHRIRTK